MNMQSILRSPQTVAKELDISPATLRRWSDEFTDYLSVGAGSNKNRSHRRYTDSDVATLVVVKELMGNGMTYEHVRQMLNGHPTVAVKPEVSPEVPGRTEGSSTIAEVERIEPLDVEALDEDEEWALIASNGAEGQAIAFLTNTLSTLSDSQKSILNSQAANRELLGVLLQDNFNLKEENNRLRERILEVERDVAQNRQEEEWRREALRQELEAKISMTGQLATEALSTARTVETPEIKAIESKPGCLGTLFGGGGAQLVTVPQRRKAEGRSQQIRHVGPPPGVPQQHFSSPQQPAGSHPKPMFPPE
jgi:DNA-binding transcriptional MerR regulator